MIMDDTTACQMHGHTTSYQAVHLLLANEGLYRSQLVSGRMNHACMQTNEWPSRQPASCQNCQVLSMVKF